MSDYTKQNDSESLFDENEIEDTKNSEDQAEEESTSSQGDSTHDDIATNAQKADAERQKQIDVWQKRIDEGFSINDLPANLNWLKRFLRSSENTTEAEIERVLQKREAERRFNEKYNELKELNLTANQKKALNNDFADLLTQGVSKDKALEIAIRANNITFTNRVAAAKMPPLSSSSYSSDEDDDGEAEIAKARAKYGVGHPEVIKVMDKYKFRK